MAQSFSCPSCGAPLDYAGKGAPTIQCPYCYSSVIVPPELRNQRSEPVPHDITLSLAGQAHKLRELSNLIRAKQRDQAASVYSQVYHVDMSNAQRFVDQLMSGNPMVITTDMGGFGSSVTTVSVGGQPSSSSSSVPLAGGAPGSYGQPKMVYTTTAGQSNMGRNLMWAVGCFVAFIFITTLVTTIVPLVIGIVVPILAIYFAN